MEKIRFNLATTRKGKEPFCGKLAGKIRWLTLLLLFIFFN
jgi:hypothetical protein